MVKSPYPRGFMRSGKQPQHAGMPQRDIDAVCGRIAVHLAANRKAQAVATILAVVSDLNEADAGNPLDQPLHTLGLPLTTLGVLESAGVLTVADTLDRSDAQLLAVPLLGRMRLREVRQTVAVWVQARAGHDKS